MPIFKVIGLATATEPQQTTNHHHHATRQPEKPLNHKPTNPLNQKTNKPIILVPTWSKSNLHRTHAIKTPTEWSPHRSKLDLHGTSEPTQSKPHWNETHAIKTWSPYTLIKTPISIEPTLIKTPLEATWSSSADQNPIGTHPKSKPTSPRRSPRTTSPRPTRPTMNSMQNGPSISSGKSWTREGVRTKSHEESQSERRRGKWEKKKE